jgi:AP-1 complex subunit beta-1
LDEPEAKASLIWIIGEYANKIDNADELLGIFVDTFTDESYAVRVVWVLFSLDLNRRLQVQLQTLTAVVKLFLQKPESSQGVVQRVLNTATKDCDSPDVRDRAYIYWRLLSTDPGAAKVYFLLSFSLELLNWLLRQAVVLAHRPPISLPQTTVSPALLEELLGEISSLASVYHKPSETFVGRGRIGADAMQKKGAELVHACTLYYVWLLTRTSSHFRTDERFSAQKALQTVVAGQQAENLLDFDDATSTEGQLSGLAATEVLSSTPAAANLLAGTSSNPLDDLVSIFGNMGGSSTGGVNGNGGMGGGLGGLSFGGGAFGSSTPQAPSIATGLPQPTSAPLPVQAQQPQEDLLGLF